MADLTALKLGNGSLTFVSAILAACSVLAAEVPVPASCEAFATVHRDSCVATSYLRCGDQVQAVSYSEGLLHDTHVFGPQWDLVGYFADDGKAEVRALAGSAPEADLTAALESGESLGTRELEFASGVLKGNKVTVDSALRFGDETVEIGGVSLRKGTLSRLMTVQKNGVTAQYDFVVYATPDASLFIEGAADVNQFGRESRLEWTPQKIVFAGEPGFLATTSDIPCGN